MGIGKALGLREHHIILLHRFLERGFQHWAMTAASGNASASAGISMWCRRSTEMSKRRRRMLSMR